MICLFTCTASRNLRRVIGKMNEDITRIERWATDNGFLLNASKTQVMIMDTSRYLNVIDHVINQLPDSWRNSNVIQFSACVRYLGVTISNNFSWEHISGVTRRVWEVLYQLRLSKHLLFQTLRIKLIIPLHFLISTTTVWFLLILLLNRIESFTGH